MNNLHFSTVVYCEDKWLKSILRYTVLCLQWGQKFCILDQDISLVVYKPEESLYIFLGVGIGLRGLVNFFITGIIKPLGPHLYQMHMQWRLVL